MSSFHYSYYSNQQEMATTFFAATPRFAVYPSSIFGFDRSIIDYVHDSTTTETCPFLLTESDTLSTLMICSGGMPLSTNMAVGGINKDTGKQGNGVQVSKLSIREMSLNGASSMNQWRSNDAYTRLKSVDDVLDAYKSYYRKVS